MSILSTGQKGDSALLMGNDAIARGALEAGICVVAGYPGTPSSEIVQQLANVAAERNLYVEWSVNEKVAMEVAASGSYAGLRSMCVMKQVGVNVAADTLLHIAECGVRGSLVLISCEDPGALSSTNEGDSRPYAKMMEFPLLEPGDFQEAKEMTRWAIELSDQLKTIVMLRSVTRLSHASGNVTMGELPEVGQPKAHFDLNGDFLDEMKGPIAPFPFFLEALRLRQKARLEKARKIFEACPFNTYEGPENPELLVISCSSSTLYVKEAISELELGGRVGLLKLGTTWPLPEKLILQHLARTNNILVVEENTAFMEDNIKSLFADSVSELGNKTFFGRKDGSIPHANELNSDILIQSLSKIMGYQYHPVGNDYLEKIQRIDQTGLPDREQTFCPGCPHRASFWVIHDALQIDNRKGFVCGDIGCYTMGAGPCGFDVIKIVMAMGTGAGMASGFGKLAQFGLHQPVMAVCGDSTFFHAVMPALANAIHNRSNMTLVVLDNSGTAMTGFQPHPGISVKAENEFVLPALDIEAICRSMGSRVEVCDPFQLKNTRETLLNLLEDDSGVNVLIMKQACALSPQKKSAKGFSMSIDSQACIADECGCNRLCTRVFKCPALIWDPNSKKTQIDEILCVGCGVCASICPTGAIQAEEA